MRKSCFLACPCSVLLCLLLLARCFFELFSFEFVPFYLCLGCAEFHCAGVGHTKKAGRGIVATWCVGRLTIIFKVVCCYLPNSFAFFTSLYSFRTHSLMHCHCCADAVRKQRKRWRRSGASNAQAIAIHRVFNIVVTMLNIVTLWSQCSTPRSQWLTLWSQCLTLWSQFPAIFWRPNPLCACVRGSQT